MIKSDQYILSTEVQDKSSSNKKLAVFITGLAVIAALLASFGLYFIYHPNFQNDGTGIHIPMSVHRPIGPDLAFEAHKKKAAKILCKDNNDNTNCPESQADIPVVVDDEKLIFIGKIVIGTPPQEFKVVFDTGIYDMWVADSSCPKSVCGDHSKYDQTKSSTFEDLHESINKSYEFYSVSGHSVKDAVELVPFMLPEYKFAAISNVVGLDGREDAFQHFPFDGVVGLGPRDSAVDSAPTVIDVLMDTNQIDQRMFAFELRDDGKQSYITIGGYKKSAVKGNIMWMDMIASSPYWGVHGDFKFGDETMATNVNLVIDSGQPGISLSSDIIEKIAPIVNGTVDMGTLEFRCDDADSAPDLEFLSGGDTFKIPFSMFSSHFTNERCFAFIIPSVTNDTIIIGETLFLTYYTIFDADSQRIGLAEYKENAV